MNKQETINNLEEVNSLLLQAEDLMARIVQNTEIDSDLSELQSLVESCVKDSQDWLDSLNNVNQHDDDCDCIDCAPEVWIG